jgi:hypothetical protein
MIITNIVHFLNQWQMPINFLAHLMIFVGACYVALHNRSLPQWHVTPLWYVGLTSVFTAMTIVCQWVFGPEFELSYFKVGLLGETALNISIAAIALIMLIVTVRKDIIGAKKRRMAQE